MKTFRKMTLIVLALSLLMSGCVLFLYVLRLSWQ